MIGSTANADATSGRPVGKIPDWIVCLGAMRSVVDGLVCLPGRNLRAVEALPRLPSSHGGGGRPRRGALLLHRSAAIRSLDRGQPYAGPLGRARHRAPVSDAIGL